LGTFQTASNVTCKNWRENVFVVYYVNWRGGGGNCSFSYMVKKGAASRPDIQAPHAGFD
jgi:hypothetical protein